MKGSRHFLLLFAITTLLTGCISVTVGPPGHVVGFVYIPGPEYVSAAGVQELLFSAEREPPTGYTPLIGADVQIRDKLGSTDGDGRFEIRDIRPGTYTLTVTHEALRSPIKRSVRIESDRVTWIGRYEEGPLFGGVGYFIVIGIGNYSEATIPGVAENAEKVYDALFENNRLAAFGAKLINWQATKVNIKQRIGMAVDLALRDSQGKSDDYLVIYFAGRSGADYLSPSDDDGSDWSKVITDAELEEWLCSFPGSVTVIIDGTESATMADGNVFQPYALKKWKYTVISVARSDEDIFYDEDLGSSVFTHYLLEGITGWRPAADWSGDGDITARELYDYIYDEMRSYFGNWQDPDSHIPGFHGGEHEHSVVFRYGN